MASSNIKLDWERLRAVVMYVMRNSDPARLGAVKLHKVLYYTDMLNFLESGKAVTGAAYRKRPFGPTCDALLPMLEEMQRDQQIKVDVVNYHGYRKKEFIPLAEVDTNQLGESERRLIDEVVTFVCDTNTAKTISDFSHDMVWDMVDYGQVIPYYNAIHLIPNEIGPDAHEWASSERKSIADSGQNLEKEKLAYRDVRALREGLDELRRSRSI